MLILKKKYKKVNKKLPKRHKNLTNLGKKARKRFRK
jgi:uncharacterized protein (UPF0216 family)